MEAALANHSVCDNCYFGVCSSPPTNGSTPVCVCADGFVHDTSFFHDPICTLPVSSLKVWFICHTIMTAILVCILLGLKPSSFNSCLARLHKRSPAVESKRFQSPTQNRGPSSYKGSRAHKAKLRLTRLCLASVVLNWMIPLGIFVEGGAGRLANVAYLLKGVAVIAWARNSVLYVVKPIARAFGQKRYTRVQQIQTYVFFGLSSSFVVMMSVLIAVNYLAQSTGSGTFEKAHTALYNTVATAVFVNAVLFGVVFGAVLTYNSTVLLRKVEATRSYQSGDEAMVSNHRRLITLRRQAWIFGVNLALGSPWLVIHFLWGIAPFYWPIYMVSFTACPVIMTSVQVTLTLPCTKNVKAQRPSRPRVNRSPELRAGNSGVSNKMDDDSVEGNEVEGTGAADNNIEDIVLM